MKIGIISDTHLVEDLSKVENLLDEEFKDTEFLIHAGDFKSPSIVSRLKESKPFLGVWGNVDDEKVKKLLREKEIIEIKGYRIGVFHGHGEKKTTLERAYDKFSEDQVDIIIFGHSHQPLIATKNKVLMLNPGSPTNKRKERWFSYIVLNLEKSSLSAQVKFFN